LIPLRACEVNSNLPSSIARFSRQIHPCTNLLEWNSWIPKAAYLRTSSASGSSRLFAFLREFASVPRVLLQDRITAVL